MPLVRRLILALLMLALALPVAAGQGMVICLDEGHLALELDHDDCGEHEEHESPAGVALRVPEEGCTDLTIGSVLSIGRGGGSLAMHHAAIVAVSEVPHLETLNTPCPLDSLAASPPLPDLLPLSTIVLRV